MKNQKIKYKVETIVKIVKVISFRNIFKGDVVKIIGFSDHRKDFKQVVKYVVQNSSNFRAVVFHSDIEPLSDG